MEAKYICAELPAALGSCYGAVVFPAFMEHKAVARALQVEPTSAGMCRKDANGKWYCYGQSLSLKLMSLEDDWKQLNKLGAE
jgi:hypothetical protein